MHKFTSFIACVAICLFASVSLAVDARPDKPEYIQTLDDQRDEIREKIAEKDGAKKALQKKKQKVDKYLARFEEERDWVVSRLAMYWDTHWITPVIRTSRTDGGEGRAPVPTPRFAGHKYPADGRVRIYWGGYEDVNDPIAAMRPYNDKNGKVWMYDHKNTGMRDKNPPQNWVKQWRTDRKLQAHNNRLLRLAARAGFVYWLTGEEKYAEFAAPILWTYMHGMSYRKLARTEGPPAEGHTSHDRLEKIISLTTYQTLGEPAKSIVRAYDVLYDYIKNNDLKYVKNIAINNGRKMNTAIIDQAIKKLADVQIQQGYAGGNWNMNQAGKIAALARRLKENEAYADGKGRSYYMDVVLNAQKMKPEDPGELSRHGNWRQTGVMQVVEQDMHPETGLWRELGGYGFGPPGGVVDIAEQLPHEDPEDAGYKLFNHPSVKKVAFSQYYVTYPNGFAPGIGISGPPKVRYGIAEKLLTWALKTDKDELAGRLSALLRSGIEEGHHERKTDGDQTLDPRRTQEKPELPETDVELSRPAVFHAKPLNIVRMTSMPETEADREHTIAAAIYGSSREAGQNHLNGMAINLYGCGHILGVEGGVGRGGRHGKRHREYHSTPPAHNTVIVNGRSANRNVDMKIEAVNPAFDREVAATESDITYTQGSYHYKKPAAHQQRTLALVRVDEMTAFFFDVFRSRRDETDPDQYHDYLYQNVGKQLKLTDGSGKPLSLKGSGRLKSGNGNLKGYDYFKNEQSVSHDGVLHAQWQNENWLKGHNPNDGAKVVMDMWMAPGENRRVFRVNAPNRRGAGYPMKKVVVRQHGAAWKQPFVAVYAPRYAEESAVIQNIQQIDDHTWLVQGDDWTAALTLKGNKLVYDLKEKN